MVALEHGTTFSYDFGMLAAYLDILRSRLRIAIVHGGDRTKQDAVIYQTFNSRPWQSHAQVAYDIRDSLQDSGFDQVFVMADDMSLPARLRDEAIHLVWLNTGGVQGYNAVSHTAAMLEMLGIPYIGHNALHAALLDNKDAFKRELNGLGIPTAPFTTWHPSQGELALGPGSRFYRSFGDYPGPFIVKPISGCASLFVHLVDDRRDLAAAVEEIYRATHNHILIEQYIDGREFSVSVCGPTIHKRGMYMRHLEPFAFAAIERIAPADERIFTALDERAHIRLVTRDEPHLHDALIGLGRAVYEELNLNFLTRIDMRADVDGRLFVLKANPKPDLKRPDAEDNNLMAAGLKEFGLNHHDLILSLLADRLDYLFRYNAHSILHIVDLLG